MLPKSSDIGNLLAVRGTVIRTGLAKMLEVTLFAGQIGTFIMPYIIIINTNT